MYKLDAKTLKQTPITTLLAKLNHNPKTQKGYIWWYYSPFRNESTPSFKVDTQQNLWHDFGGGDKEGGDIIRLVEKLYNMTFTEALNELARLTGYTNHTSTYTLKNTPQTPPQETKQKERVEIKKIQPLQNEALIEYLKSRKVNIEIAKHYLEEIYYEIDNKNYFTISFKNNSGGYEIRNKFFQGSLKGFSKDITTIQSTHQDPNKNKLLIFEGFIDFLSFFTVKNIDSIQDLQEDVIVLNSLSFTDKLIQLLKQNEELKDGDNFEMYSQYKEIYLYLDTDSAGRKATNKFLLELDDIKVIDESNLYAKQRGDLNDIL